MKTTLSKLIKLLMLGTATGVSWEGVMGVRMGRREVRIHEEPL
jgi:hypothetical protein